MGFPIPISRETNFQIVFPYYIAVNRHIRLWNKVTYKQKRKARPNQSLRTLGMENLSDEFRGGRRERRKPKDEAAHMMQCTCIVIKFVLVGLESFCLLEER